MKARNLLGSYGLEILLMAAVLFYWVYSTPWNPIAMGLFLLLVFQLFFQNKLVGILLPSLFFLASFFMLFAVMAEFNDFPTVNSEAIVLLIVGLSFFIGIMTVSVAMMYKYANIASRTA